MSNKLEYLDKKGLAKVFSILKNGLKYKPTCKDVNGDLVTGQKIVELTKAQYDALATKDQNTYYMITDDTTVISPGYGYPRPDWANAVEITDLPFTAPDDGTLVLIVGTPGVYGGRNFYIDDIKVGEFQSTSNSVGSISTLTFPICKGQVLSSKGAYTAVWGSYKFVPWK